MPDELHILLCLTQQKCSHALGLDGSEVLGDPVLHRGGTSGLGTLASGRFWD